ncbi:hypothetical protein DFP72DRAFT_1174971 [Ephemerocybe angulata]|uniref:Uncharacterized protein n=1 Tax=Ephemerocybe angulata TaxID=980116 RepID=A0A8H6HIE3_9AGAR|nr:hypothetical protein DFP72DRAFT_1174971 [Tulosesus angulatus]
MLKSTLSSSQKGLRILHTASRRISGAQKLARPAGSAPYSTFSKADGVPLPVYATRPPQGRSRSSLTFPPLPNSKPIRSAPSNPPSNTPIDPKALSELLTLLDNLKSKNICNSDVLYTIHHTHSLKSLFASPEAFLPLALHLAHSHSHNDRNTNLARHLPALIRLAHHLQVPLTDPDFTLLLHAHFDAHAYRLASTLIETTITTYGPSASLLHYKARSALRQNDFKWLPTLLRTFKSHDIEPTRKTFHIMLKAALMQDRDASSECVRHVLKTMEANGHAPDARTDALVLRHTLHLSRGGLRDVDKGALAAIAKQPLDNRKLNILNNLLWARLGETPPRDVGDLLDMLGGTEEGRRLAEIVRGSTLGVAASPSEFPSANEEQHRPESQSHSQLIRTPPNCNIYKTLISGIALKHKDLDTAAPPLARAPLARVHRARHAPPVPRLGEVGEERDEFGGMSNGVVLAIRFLASTCDARKTTEDDFVRICRSHFLMYGWPARTEGGVVTRILGPREYDSVSDSGEGGRGQKPPSAEVFKEFMRGVLRLRGRMFDADGEILLWIMRENGVEVDKESEELASKLGEKFVKDWWRERNRLARG